MIEKRMNARVVNPGHLFPVIKILDKLSLSVRMLLSFVLYFSLVALLTSVV